MSVGRDGSGVELRTKPLKGEAGFEALRGIMNALRGAGGYITRADGMHVHFECKDFFAQPERIKTLVSMWTENQGIIDKYVDAGRRKNGCTPKWTKTDISLLQKAPLSEPNAYLSYGPRGCINIAPIRSSKRTIEIRQHEGTLDPDVAIAWIKLCQAIFDKAIRPRTKAGRHASCQAMLDYLALPKSVQESLAKKERAEKAAAGKSRMLTYNQAQVQLRRDRALDIARANDDAMGPLAGHNGAAPVPA